MNNFIDIDEIRINTSHLVEYRPTDTDAFGNPKFCIHITTTEADFYLSYKTANDRDFMLTRLDSRLKTMCLG